MRLLILALLVSLVACAATPLPPAAPIAASVAHNYADAYVAAVDPDARRMAIDVDAVLVRKGLQMFVCIADASHHTECHVLADWTPKPEAKPAPQSVPTPTIDHAPASIPPPPAKKK